MIAFIILFSSFSILKPSSANNVSMESCLNVLQKTTKVSSNELGEKSDHKCVFPRKIVILGGQGSGKSSLGNSFLGWRLGQNNKESGPFNVGHGVEAGTLESTYSSGSWLGRHDSPGVTIIDTPGFNSSFNELEELIWLLADMKEIQMFVIVFKHGDRFNPELARSLNTVGKLLGSIWRNVAVVVSHWSFNQAESERRAKLRINQKKFSEHLSHTLKNKLNIDFDLPIFFIDSHFDSRDDTEGRNFVIESHKLWSHMRTLESWTSHTKSDIEAAMRLIRKKFGEIKEKCLVFLEEKSILKELEIENDSILKVHHDMIEDLREQVDSLKTNCLAFEGRNF